jgi:hypothetical protein
MALPVVANSFRYRTYVVTMADISAPSSAFVAAAFRGKIIGGYVTIQNAITGSDSALTVKIGPAGASGTAVTGMTGTAAVSGSAAGTVFTMATPTGANVIAAGDNIECITDGASSTTAIATWTIVVQEF